MTFEIHELEEPRSPFATACERTMELRVVGWTLYDGSERAGDSNHYYDPYPERRP